MTIRTKFVDDHLVIEMNDGSDITPSLVADIANSWDFNPRPFVIREPTEEELSRARAVADISPALLAFTMKGIGVSAWPIVIDRTADWCEGMAFDELQKTLGSRDMVTQLELSAAFKNARVKHIPPGTNARHYFC